MPLIPDLSRTCKTDATFPPNIGTPVVRRKKGTTSFVWSLPLVWDLAVDTGSITLPPPFSRDRGDILAAMAGEGPAYARKHHAQREVTLAVAVRVGQERLPVFEGATGLVRSIEVAASKDAGVVKAIVAVEIPQTLAAGMLDLFDADVDVSVVTDGELPLGGQTQADDPEDLGETDDPEPRQETLETLSQAQARRRKAVAVEELPPEPDADDELVEDLS